MNGVGLASTFRKSLGCLLGLALAALGPWPGVAGNWPSWRGPDGTGVSPEKHLPEKWSATEKVRWKTTLPEAGNSSPIIRRRTGLWISVAGRSMDKTRARGKP